MISRENGVRKTRVRVHFRHEQDESPGREYDRGRVGKRVQVHFSDGGWARGLPRDQPIVGHRWMRQSQT
jgi:hypothetical protein